MSYVLSKLAERGWISQQRSNNLSAYWDLAQGLFGETARYTFLPITIVAASYMVRSLSASSDSR
jgi:hypothetical protein